MGYDSLVGELKLAGVEECIVTFLYFYVISHLFMKLLFLVTFLLAILISFGQTIKVQTIKQTNPITKEVYIFPKVIVLNSSIVTNKINNKLRGDVLGMSLNTKDANIFDSVWRTNYRMEDITNLSFEVCEANASLISLSISGEGCGAYCEAFNYHFTFNAKTGNHLTLDSLFTQQGLFTFVKILNDNKRQKLNGKLEQINRSLTLPSVKTDAQEKERFSEMLSMYTDCLEKKIDIQFVSYIQFLIKSGIIIVYTDRCSAHYNMTYDELWTFMHSADLKNSKELLSAYGLSLINK